MNGPDPPNVPPPDRSPAGVFFRRFFTRNGKTYDAWDYGHKAWPIGRRKRR